MYRVTLAGLALCVSAAASAAQPSSSASAWRLDAKGASCEAVQTLRDGTRVVISRRPGADATYVEIVSRGTPPEQPLLVERVMLSLDSGPAFPAEGEFGPGERRGTRELAVSVAGQGFLEALSAAGWIEANLAQFGSVRAPTALPATILAGLRRCEDKKMERWGIDPTWWRSLRKRPVLLVPQSQLFTVNDYPLDAEFSQHMGGVIAKLTVGADGRVADCSIAKSSGRGLLDRRTCEKLTRRARFEPARDQADRPVTAPYIVFIRYCIEGIWGSRCPEL